MKESAVVGKFRGTVLSGYNSGSVKTGNSDKTHCTACCKSTKDSLLIVVVLVVVVVN